MARRLPEPEEILAGRAAVDLPTLVTVVHRVNPTDRGLRRAETERRYALKSRLQSLLLRRYAERVLVRWSGEDEVLLEVPSDGRDAGHAKVWALDEDVRPLVRSRADADPTPAPAAERSASRRASAAAIADGDRETAEAALEGGDYEGAAERWLARARRGDVAAAREGLAVLVDWLGDADRAAREHATFPAEVAADPGVRVVVARGRVRAGDADGAEALVGDAEGAEAGAVWVEIADHRLAARDRAAGRRAIDRLARADPARRQEALARADRLRALEDAECAPLRAAVDAALAGRGDLEAALAALERAAPRDPHAVAVRERLRRAEATTRARARFAEAERAVEAHRWDLAQRLLAELSAEPVVDQGALAGLRERLRSTRAEVAVAAVRSALGPSPDVEAVAAWLALDPPDRARARPDPRPPALEVAEELAAGLRRDPRVLAEAAVAVARARQLLDGGREEEAAAQLQDHGALVDACRLGRAVRDELRRRATARAADAARSLLDEGLRLLARDPAGALARLERVERVGAGALDATEARALAEAMDEARRALGEQAFAARFEEVLRAEPWRAADLARDEGERARAEEAKRAAITVVRLGPGPAPTTLVLDLCSTDGQPARALEPDGRTAVLPELWGTTLALFRVSLPDLAVLHGVLLRLPLAPKDGIEVALLREPLVPGAPGGELWVMGGGGLLLVADPDTLEPRRWTVLDDLLPGSIEVSPLGVAYADRRLPQDRCWCVLDPATLRVTDRGRPWTERWRAVPGLDGAVAERDDGTFVRVRRDGSLLASGPLVQRHRANGIALHPSAPDELLVQLRTEPRRHEVAVLGTAGEVGRVHRVSAGTNAAYLAADPGCGLVFQAWRHPSRTSGVVRAGEPTGARVWEVSTPAVVVLLQSAAGGPVAALTTGDEGLVFRWLGRAAPDLPGPNPVALTGVVGAQRACDGRALRRAAPPALRDAIAGAADPVAAAREALARAASPDVVLRALIDAGHDPPADLVDPLPEPLRGSVRVHHAERLAADRRWAEVVATLTPVPDELPPALGSHARHLVEHARSMILETRGHDFPERSPTCDWSALQHHAGHIRVTGAEPTAHHGALVGAADTAFAAGDLDAALQILLLPTTLHGGDLQAAGRRLHALRVAPGGPALIDVLRARWLYDSARGDVPYQGAWTTARLAEERRWAEVFLADTPFADAARRGREA